MTAAQIAAFLALVVLWCLIGAIAGALANLRADSDMDAVVRSIDGNAAFPFVLREED